MVNTHMNVPLNKNRICIIFERKILLENQHKLHYLQIYIHICTSHHPLHIQTLYIIQNEVFTLPSHVVIILITWLFITRFHTHVYLLLFRCVVSVYFIALHIRCLTTIIVSTFHSFLYHQKANLNVFVFFGICVFWVCIHMY